VRLLLALSALEDWEIEALDVKTAFLYGNLNEELYMEQPEGFIVTTWYGLLHYANLIRQTSPVIFPFNLLNLATPLTTYMVRLVLLILVPLSSLPCYLYDTVLILTSDILYSLINTFLSILRYINTHVFIVEP
jgi:hypothetical protein